MNAQPMQAETAVRSEVKGGETRPYRKWQCVPCGEIYDEALGVPDMGIAPGTRWEDVPEDWLCAACGVGKSEYVLLEE